MGVGELITTIVRLGRRIRGFEIGWVLWEGEVSRGWAGGVMTV